MIIVMPALAVAFAAFCVWLTVRTVNRRERWATWTALGLLIVLVGYPLSIGPAHCFVWNANTSWIYKTADVVYSPIACACDKSEAATRWIFWYDRLWDDFRVRRRFMGIDLPPGFELEPLGM